MKNLSKVMALVLCLAMVFVLCACGGSDTEKFVGTWEAEVDMTDAAMASLEEELADLMDYFEFDKLISVMTLTFNEDGTYEMDVALTDESVENYNNALRNGLKAMMDDSAAADLEMYGMTMEEYEAAYVELYGMTFSEYVDAFIEATMEEIDIQQIMADSSVEGNWKVDGGKLYMTEDVDDEFAADTYDLYEDLTDAGFKIVNEFNDGAEDDSVIYPIEFSKVG